MSGGPLAGVRVIELAGQGPTPHAAMLLADWGADVVRLVRPASTGDLADAHLDTQLRNRTLIPVDLKDVDQAAAVLDLVADADVFIEGFRPNVAERLGLGPVDCQARNAGLIYARMTGWGQTGPWAHTAGHDVNYLSVTGILSTIGPSDAPVIPLNLLGDFGGGSMFVVAGILAALHERHTSGRGQIIDAAMVDGISQLAHMIWSFRHFGIWQEHRCSNPLDGGTPWYSLYRCADGQFVAVGAIEEPFYAALLDGLDLDPRDLPGRADRGSWPALRAVLAERFASQPRDHWASVFDGTDACVTPVLTMTEATSHPHMHDRGVLPTYDGAQQPAPAPRFSRSGSAPHRAPASAISDLASQKRAWSTVP